jgi:hypothetical protein
VEVEVLGLARRTRAVYVANDETATRDILAAVLRDAGWQVEVEPVLGSTRPDLLLSDDYGNTIVVELKRAPHGVHFGSVAQTAAFRDAAESALGRDVGAMLVILGTDAHELEAAGRDYRVEVAGSASSAPADVADIVRTRLLALPKAAEA